MVVNRRLTVFGGLHFGDLLKMTKIKKSVVKSNSNDTISESVRLTLPVDTSAAKASTYDQAAIGARMKEARERLGLSRPAFATVSGGDVKVRTLENNEAGVNEPGARILDAFVRRGVSANWLISNEGEMLINPHRDAAASNELLAASSTAGFASMINVDALEAIIEGALRISPNLPANRLAAHCAALYQRCIDDGMITPEGIGPGDSETAA